MKKPKVTVIGSINMDLVTKSEKVPKIGETIIGESFSMIPGGKGANQAVAAARLGAEVTLIGSVGNDFFGRELLNDLQRENIILDYVEPVTHNSTGIASITISGNDNSIIVVSGANYDLTPDKIEKHEQVIANSDVILLQLEIPLESVIKAVDIARKYNVKVILNPAPAKELPQYFIDNVDFITPNEHELQLFLPDNADNDLNEQLQKLGEKFIVTKGKEGVYFYQNQQIKNIPGYTVKVTDTTGAGDSFNGAFAVAISEGLDLEEACEFGNAVAALSVTKFGAQNGMPKRDEVDEFIRSRKG